MRSTEGDGELGERPIVPDPPEWFNKGRTEAIRREVVRPRPVSPVRPPIFEQPAGWFHKIRVSGVTTGPQATRGVCPPPLVARPAVPAHPVAPPDFPTPPVRRGAGAGWIIVAAVFALPLVFAGGFLASRLFPHNEPLTAGTLAAAEVASSPSAPQISNADRWDAAGDSEIEHTSAPRAQVDQDEPISAPIASIDRPAPVESRRNVAGPETASVRPEETKDGFVLRPAAANASFAEIRPARNAWFALASAEQTCDSGACKIAPVSAADAKLNTALDWSSSSSAAADLARREGKLVFLIHVSGNFAQPGFT